MLLLYVYVASLIVGGILLGASVFLGHDSHDLDAGADLDGDLGGDIHVDADADADADVDGDLHVDAEASADAHVAGGGGLGLSDLWLPFVSLRFWVFFLCFFGMTGTVFALLALAGPRATLLSALGVGGASGFAAAFILQRLRRSEPGRLAGASQYCGLEGKVLIDVPAEGRGKIRVELRGNTVDLVARSVEGEHPRGGRVMVIEMQGTEAMVVAAPHGEV